MPTLTMIAGPNGSGKSTITAAGSFGETSNLIDPDAIARTMNPDDPAQAALAAGRQAILRARSFVEQRVSFSVETTLAGNGQLMLLAEAKRAGFEINVFYVALTRVEMQVDRVQIRISQGGHSVPPDDIRRRYERSLANAPKALRMAHLGIVFDNSGLEPAPVLRLKDGVIIWEQPGAIPAWVVGLKLALTSPDAD